MSCNQNSHPPLYSMPLSTAQTLGKPISTAQINVPLWLYLPFLGKLFLLPANRTNSELSLIIHVENHFFLFAGEMISAVEASSLSAVSLNPRINRPSFFNHVMLDTGERNFLCPHKQCNLFMNANFGAGARISPACYAPFMKSSRSRSLISCQVMREESGGTLSGESILLNEQTLERELKVAIDQENYVQAAKLRDSLRLLQEDSKAAVLAANARFYNSFRNGDLAAMQALWSTGEHVCVVHPGVSGISGYDLVMGSWEFVWADYEFPLEIETKDVQVHVRGDVGYVTCIEMVKTKGSSWGRHFTSNVFEKVKGQWHICIHHASYVDL